MTEKDGISSSPALHDKEIRLSSGSVFAQPLTKMQLRARTHHFHAHKRAFSALRKTLTICLTLLLGLGVFSGQVAHADPSIGPELPKTSAPQPCGLPRTSSRIPAKFYLDTDDSDLGVSLFGASERSNLEDLLSVGSSLFSDPSVGSVPSPSSSNALGIKLYSLSVEQAPEHTLYLGRVERVSPQARVAGWKTRETYGGQIDAGGVTLQASALKVLDPRDADQIRNTRYSVRNHNSLRTLSLPLPSQNQVSVRLGLDTQILLDHGLPSGSALPNASIEWSRPLGKYSTLRIEAYGGVQSPELSLSGLGDTGPLVEVGGRASLLHF